MSKRQKLLQLVPAVAMLLALSSVTPVAAAPGTGVVDDYAASVTVERDEATGQVVSTTSNGYEAFDQFEPATEWWWQLDHHGQWPHYGRHHWHHYHDDMQWRDDQCD